jgi:hypothetical protein
MIIIIIWMRAQQVQKLIKHAFYLEQNNSNNNNNSVALIILRSQNFIASRSKVYELSQTPRKFRYFFVILQENI